MEHVTVITNSPPIHETPFDHDNDRSKERKGFRSYFPRKAMKTGTMMENKLEAYASLDEARADNLVETEKISVSFYQNEIPEFVELELERLYENIFSSIVKLKIDDKLHNANVYVARKNSKVQAVLLFHQDKGRVEVLNEVIKLDGEDIYRFAKAVFTKYKIVTVISFHAIQTGIFDIAYPYQKFNYLEDVVLSLPDTPEMYFSDLGKNMRSSIKRYQKKVNQDFPSFRYEIYENADVRDQHIRDIIKLSSARMAHKNKVSLHDDRKTEQLIRLVQMSGLVTVAMVEGCVCAGVICSRSGKNYFMHVVAHDPQFDDYRLGKLSCYRAICECINRGGKEFHFLWGRNEYKYRLLGVQRELDHISVYRSRTELLFNGRMALKVAFKGYGRLIKRWLLEKNRFTAKFAIKIDNSVNKLKQIKLAGTIRRM